jgi:hypothetical protein
MKASSARPAGREACFLAQTLKASIGIVIDYLGLFVNRRAYTIQSMRLHPESGVTLFPA